MRTALGPTTSSPCRATDGDEAAARSCQARKWTCDRPDCACRISIRHRLPDDNAGVLAFLRENHSERVARLGRIEHPLDHPILVAERDGRLAGVLTYVIADGECEILTLHAVERWHGIGSALIAEVERLAAERGCSHLWVLTTNDNVDALRFYQRRGFRLAQLNAGAVERARATLKPEITTHGLHDIPIRDEAVLEKLLS